ncbi:MAG: V-type ATPase subunit, partial [Candidatus Alkanophagales archaeon]
MGLLEYAYVYVRARARMGYLLGERELRALMEARSLEDFISSLMDSPYREKLSRVSAASARDVELALMEDLIDQYLMVIRSSRGEVSEFFKELLRRLEVENLKAVLRAKAAGVAERPPLYPVEDFFKRRLSRLLEAEDVEAVIRLVESPYREVLEKAFPEYQESRRVLVLENALNEELFKAIWGRVEALPARDKELARRVLGAEFDVTNVMTLLRCKHEDVEPSEIRRYLLPYGYAFDVEAAAVRDAIMAEDVSAAALRLAEDKAFTPYRAALQHAAHEYEAERSLLPFETALRRSLLGVVREILRGYPMNIGTVIGFLLL